MQQQRPWSWISTMFVLVGSLCWSLLDHLTINIYSSISALNGSSFVPGPEKICNAIFLVAIWEFPIFLAAADLVMIMRVYAMWSQSKWILYILLLIYIPQMISILIIQGIYDNPNTYLSFTVIQLDGFSFCNSSSTAPSLLDIYDLTPRFVLGLILLVLGLVQTSKQALQMYRATKQWQPNRNALYNFILVWLYTDPTIDNILLLFLTSFSYVTLFPMMPRFIISIRELYDHDHRGRLQGIDTGFGVSSQPVDSENTAVSTIAFADVAGGQEQGQAAEGDKGDSAGNQLGVHVGSESGEFA
ncbi:hypothetical protein V8E55_011480 [Tylopilus felleus]